MLASGAAWFSFARNNEDDTSFVAVGLEGMGSGNIRPRRKS